MTEPVVGVAGPADAQAVADLWTEAFATGHPQGASTPYSTIDFDDTDEVAIVFVARVEGAIVGTVSLFDSAHEGINRPGEAELARLAVAGRARRMGVGRLLVERVHAEALERGDRGVVLWSGPHQVEGHALYESLGYTRDPGRDELGEDDRERLVYVRPLG